MAKFLEITILIALIAIPARAARDPNPKKGLKKAIVHAIYFNLLYLFILMFVHGRFVE